MDNSKIQGLVLRYSMILIAGFGNLFLFYKIMTPLTLQGSFALINIFSRGLLQGNSIFLTDKIIKLIPACIAGSAYYLLFILVFSTLDINIKKRFKILIFSFSIFYVINVLRIVTFTFLHISLFETLHIISWYFLSTFLVVGIWLSSVKLFKIKSIPVYSDLIFLYHLTKQSKKPRRTK